MRLQLLGVFFVLAASLVRAPTSSAAVTPGQVDTFTGGTTMNWTNGGAGFGIINVNHDGPGGATDSFMQVSSGSFGGQQKLITFNLNQWIGNFTGVAGVRMDLKNLDSSATPVARPIRIAIREDNGASGTPGYASTAFTVPADGNWHQSVFFPFTTLTMTPVNSPTNSVATDLANVRDFRILSAINPGLIGDGISAVIGFDNIAAVPKGDWNQDGAFTLADVQAMLDGLADLDAYKLQKNLDGIGLLALGDFNFDGAVTNADIQPVLDRLAASGAGSISAVPEPASWIAAGWALGTLGLLIRKNRRG